MMRHQVCHNQGGHCILQRYGGTSTLGGGSNVLSIASYVCNRRYTRSLVSASHARILQRAISVPVNFHLAWNLDGLSVIIALLSKAITYHKFTTRRKVEGTPYGVEYRALCPWARIVSS